MRHLFLALTLLLAGPALAASALPPAVVKDARLPLHLNGSGEFRKFFLHIYDASLWMEGSQTKRDNTFALHIVYARDLPARGIVDISLDEMNRLKTPSASQLTLWGQDLARVIPDVKKGDSLTGLYRPGSGTHFYHNGRKTGAVKDPAFGEAFFAIWLDERTLAPALRAALLGCSDDPSAC